MGRFVNASLEHLAGAARIGAFWIVALIFSVAPAHAQAVQQFTVLDAGTTNDITGATTCAAPLVQSFAVGNSFTVDDVDLGFFASHSWRGDIRLTLIAPGGTSVQLVNGDVNFNPDNFNKLLGDQFTILVNATGDTANDVLTPVPAPPTQAYQRSVRPNGALSGFNGVDSIGTWQLQICDIFPGADNGNFRRADLFLSPRLTTINVTKASTVLNDGVSVSNPKSIPNATVQYCVTVTNSGAGIATTASATDTVPANMTYIANTMRSGATCGAAATIEDDDATGADDTDAVGASITGGVITIVVPKLDPAASIVVTFNATIN
jgi:uncharacterized repeat protein (TIGR01451 family)